MTHVSRLLTHHSVSRFKSQTEVVSCNQVFEWLRNMVANRLATSAAEWTTIFSQHNSGTYNNQWMVVDFNLFEPGQPLQNGTLFVLEQFPG